MNVTKESHCGFIPAFDSPLGLKYIWYSQLQEVYPIQIHPRSPLLQ